MKPDPLLRSAGPSHAGDSLQRVFADRRRGDVAVGPFGPRLPSPRPSAAPGAKPSNRRGKLWELTAMLHCSIVGTCLPTGELRSLLRRSDPALNAGASDHDVHSIAVGAAGRHGELSKQIQKALDRRHRLAIERFSRARSSEDLRTLWDEAMR